MPELDEFGIPIKSSGVDEFGIPKKQTSAPALNPHPVVPQKPTTALRGYLKGLPGVNADDINKLSDQELETKYKNYAADKEFKQNVNIGSQIAGSQMAEGEEGQEKTTQVPQTKPKEGLGYKESTGEGINEDKQKQNNTMFDIAQSYENSGNYDKAQNIITGIAAENKDNPDMADWSNRKLADISIKKGDFAGAAQTLDTIKNKTLADFNSLAYSKLQQGDVAGALKNIQPVLSADGEKYENIDDKLYALDIQGHIANDAGNTELATSISKEKEQLTTQKKALEVKQGEDAELAMLKQPEKIMVEFLKAIPGASSGIATGIESIVNRGAELEQGKDIAKNTLGMVKDLMGISFSALMGTPQLTTIFQGIPAMSNLIQEGLTNNPDIITKHEGIADKVSEWAFSPATKFAEATGVIPKGGKESLASEFLGIGDIIVGGLMMDSGHELYNKLFKDGKAGEVTQEQITAAINEIKKEKPELSSALTNLKDGKQLSHEELETVLKESEKGLNTEKLKKDIENNTGKTVSAAKPRITEVKEVKPIIEGEKGTYTGADHGEAMNEAISKGEEIPNPDTDEGKKFRQDNGKFEVTDNSGEKKIITREEAKDQLGFDHSEDIPEELKGEQEFSGKDYIRKVAETSNNPNEIADKDIEDKFNDAVKEKEEDEKRINETEVHDKYKKLEDTWLGNIDEKNLEANSEATNFQEEIQKATPKGTKWRDIDKAIHIYLDTKNNPEHYNQHYEKLTPEQKRIADLSQNLTPEQKAIADKISKSYEDVGKLSKEEGIIKETLDNYVARAWDFKGKAATDINKAFTTSTRHSLNRTLETILEGQAKGYNLKVEGATNNLEILRQEINSVIENKRLIDEGSKIPVGEKIEGEPQKKLFMTFPTDGYKKVENPFFKKWDFAGKVSDQDEAQLMGQRKDIVVTEDGNIIQKKDVYAPDKVANNLNNILGESKLKGIPAFDWFRHFNTTVKESVLLTSLFHPIAFLRNKFESGAFNKLGDLSPTEAKNQGLQYIKDLTPHIRTLVRNGLTIGKIQDWDELSLQQKGSVSKLMEKWNVTKSISDKVGDLVYNQKHWLFENFGAGLKAFDAVNALKNEIIKNPGKDINEIAKAVAKTCNNNYGGLHLKRIGRNPTIQDIFHLVCLAPDWTESNLRMAVAAFKGGYEGEFARKMWTKVAMRGTTALALTNIAMAFMPDPNDKSKDPVQNAVDRFKRAWDEGNLDWAKMNISPLAHAMGAPTNKDYYFSVFGHYTDPIRLISGTADPLIALAPGKLAKSFGGSTSSLKFFLNKGSIVTKMAGQALTAQDWKGQEYTTIDELLGIDDKGKYTKTQKEHKKGDISPTTGKPYVSDKAGFESGTEKGGKLEGKLVKSSIDKSHPVEIPQIPSWGIEQIRGSIPIPLANLWQYLEGENDGFTTIANSVGLGITKVGQPKDKKAETPITPPTDKVSKDKESTDKESEDKVSPDKADEINKVLGTSNTKEHKEHPVKVHKVGKHIKNDEQTPDEPTSENHIESKFDRNKSVIESKGDYA